MKKMQIPLFFALLMGIFVIGVILITNITPGFAQSGCVEGQLCSIFITYTPEPIIPTAVVEQSAGGGEPPTAIPTDGESGFVPSPEPILTDSVIPSPVNVTPPTSTPRPPTPTPPPQGIYTCVYYNANGFIDILGWYTDPNGQRFLILIDGDDIPESQIRITDACKDAPIPEVNRYGLPPSARLEDCGFGTLPDDILREQLNRKFIQPYALRSNDPCAAVQAIFDDTQISPPPMPLIDASQFPDDCNWAIPEFVESWDQLGELKGLDVFVTGDVVAKAIYDAALSLENPCDFVLAVVRDHQLPGNYPDAYLPEFLPLVCNPDMSNELYVKVVNRLRTLGLNKNDIDQLIQADGAECLPIISLSRAGAFVGSHIDFENYLVDTCLSGAMTAIHYSVVVVSSGLDASEILRQLQESFDDTETCLSKLNEIIFRLLIQKPPQPPETCDATLINNFQSYQNDPSLAEDISNLQNADGNTSCSAIENYIRTGYALPQPENSVISVPLDTTVLASELLSQGIEKPADTIRRRLPPLLRNAAAVFVAKSSSKPDSPGDIYFVRNGWYEKLPLTNDYDESFPVLSADGRYIAYIQNDTFNNERKIFIQAIPQSGQDISEPRPLVRENENFKIPDYPMAFSPDGQYLVFTLLAKDGGEYRPAIYRFDNPLDNNKEPGEKPNATPEFKDAYSPSYGATLDQADDIFWLAYERTFPDGAQIYLSGYKSDGELVEGEYQIAGYKGNRGLNNVWDCTQPMFTVNYITLYFRCRENNTADAYVYEIKRIAAYPLDILSIPGLEEVTTVLDLAPGPEQGFMVFGDGQKLYFVQRGDSGVIASNAGTTLTMNPNSLIILSIQGLHLSDMRWAAPEKKGKYNQ